jgi:hypothetical protein
MAGDAEAGATVRFAIRVPPQRGGFGLSMPMLQERGRRAGADLSAAPATSCEELGARMEVVAVRTVEKLLDIAAAGALRQEELAAWACELPTPAEVALAPRRAAPAPRDMAARAAAEPAAATDDAARAAAEAARGPPAHFSREYLAALLARGVEASREVGPGSSNVPGRGAALGRARRRARRRGRGRARARAGAWLRALEFEAAAAEARPLDLAELARTRAQRARCEAAMGGAVARAAGARARRGACGWTRPPSGARRRGGPRRSSDFVAALVLRRSVRCSGGERGREERGRAEWLEQRWVVHDHHHDDVGLHRAVVRGRRSPDLRIGYCCVAHRYRGQTCALVARSRALPRELSPDKSALACKFGPNPGARMLRSVRGSPPASHDAGAEAKLLELADRDELAAAAGAPLPPRRDSGAAAADDEDGDSFGEAEGGAGGAVAPPAPQLSAAALASVITQVDSASGDGGGRLDPGPGSGAAGGPGGWRARVRAALCCLAPSGLRGGRPAAGLADADAHGGAGGAGALAAAPPPAWDAPALGAQSPRHAGRACLVLDLDETLVHSSFRPVPSPDYVIPVR